MKRRKHLLYALFPKHRCLCDISMPDGARVSPLQREFRPIIRCECVPGLSKDQSETRIVYEPTRPSGSLKCQPIRNVQRRRTGQSSFRREKCNQYRFAKQSPLSLCELKRFHWLMCAYIERPRGLHIECICILLCKIIN